MKTFAVICFALWIYILYIIKRGKNNFLFFLIGSVGMFTFLMLFLREPLISPITSIVAWLAGLIGKLTGYYLTNYDLGMAYISSGENSISLYIDYECAGVIEIFVYISLLMFFPVYDFFERVLYSLLGSVFLILANVLRFVTICFVIHFFGSDSYFIAHSVVGRILFYALSMGLYFTMFTKAQLKRQKVGNFKYGA